MNPYKTLNIKKEATDQDIKFAYRQLSKHYHPDVNNGQSQKFMEINLAYKVLSDPIKRKLYDDEGIILDDNPNHVDNIVRNRLAQIANAWLDLCMKGQKVDLKEMVLANLKQGQSEITNNNVNMKRTILLLEDMYKKLTYKDENKSIVHNVIKSRIEGLKKGMKQNENELTVIKNIRLIIVEYEYEQEEELITIMTGTSSTGGSTTTFSYG
jgi:hypothetical protein